MGKVPKHISWLTDTGERQKTACGREIEIWELSPEENEKILSEWARYYRHHYISDDELPAMVHGTGLTNAQYLEKYKFPDAKQKPGPSIRSGDFGEILVADFIEFMLGYWAPRELRYQDRHIRNESEKGCDVIGFKLAQEEGESPNDELFITESKSGTAKSKKNRLQDAIDDSGKDKLRESFTLNALKQRFLRQGRMDDVNRVERFQLEADRPFKRINAAAAVLDDVVFDDTDLGACDASGHPNATNLRLIVIKAPSLMTLIHALYKRAADEA